MFSIPKSLDRDVTLGERQTQKNRGRGGDSPGVLDGDVGYMGCGEDIYLYNSSVTLKVGKYSSN